jgi:predicted TIM-barrel fold metal-dependent hydrolase
MTIEVMDQHNIILGYLSGSIENMQKWTAAAPGRFITAPLIYEPAEVNIDQLRVLYRSGTLGGMGELATQYDGYAPTDPKVAPLFELAIEFDLPTHIHTLGIGAPKPTFRVSNGDPRLLEEVLVRYPKLRLFVENCGFPFADEMTAMMYQYPQLYCEISTILHLTPRSAAIPFFKRLIDNGLGKRIMFGSDQMIWPEVIPIVIEAIQAAEFLTTEQKADIFYNNAARFLRLSKEDIARHHALVSDR